MLRREEAQEQLKAFAADGAGAPGPGLARRLLGGALAGRLERWVADPAATDAQQLGEELDGLSERQRARAFAAVCPSLADPLSRWWDWATAAPYQGGFARRGFRSSDPADSRRVRSGRLHGLLRLGRRWPQDPEWLAAWLSHVPAPHDALAQLLASEIDAGRTAIADTLVASAFGQHPISGITRDAIGALLGCNRPEHWEQVVTLLRNAGRQEGLRSAVLEAVDLAHPDAFARIVGVVVEDDLARFAGTVRAAGVWFGEELTVRTSRQLGTVLAELARAMRGQEVATSPGTPAETFLRLTALAHRDARRAVPAAAALLGDDDPAIRRAAARLLAELGLDVARDALRPARADPDLTVYATAVSAWPTSPFARDVDARLDDASTAVLLERIRTLGKAAEGGHRADR